MITLTAIIGFLITLFILSILVLIHEFGHFITAKRLGIKVEEFGFGFPPKAWGKKIGETTYTINWLPIGGFVKLHGEDDAGGGKVNLKDLTKDVTDIKRAFFARPVWQRALVVLAGVIMNSLLAFIIYYGFMFLAGFQTELPLLNDHKFFAAEQRNKLNNIVIRGVSENSPAANAGIRECSEEYCASIVTINGREPQNSEDFGDTVRKNKGREITLGIKNLAGDKDTETITLIPRENPPKNEGALGIEFSIIETVELLYKTPVQKLLSGITHPLNLMSYNFSVMKTLITQAIVEKDTEALSTGISGPVGIVRLGSQINQIVDLRERFMQFLNLAGLLSISLAVFNVLPIPALDGGRLFFILLEGITRKKVSPKIEGVIHTVGMFLLLGLILLITFKDIFQIFS
jgi:regulator of sigma E protease